MIEQEVIERIKKKGILDALDKEIRRLASQIQSNVIPTEEWKCNTDKGRRIMQSKVAISKTYCDQICQFLDECENVCRR